MEFHEIEFIASNVPGWSDRLAIDAGGRALYDSHSNDPAPADPRIEASSRGGTGIMGTVNG